MFEMQRCPKIMQGEIVYGIDTDKRYLMIIKDNPQVVRGSGVGGTPNSSVVDFDTINAMLDKHSVLTTFDIKQEIYGGKDGSNYGSSLMAVLAHLGLVTPDRGNHEVLPKRL